MDRGGVYSWSNPWLRWSVISFAVVVPLSFAVAFVWLPSAQRDFSAAGLWTAICRAAGVPGRWAGEAAPPKAAMRSTQVVLDHEMAKAGSGEAVARGTALSTQCAACHVRSGASPAGAPSLAGQYPEVIIKQLMDYRQGDRVSAMMQAIAAPLAERDVRDLAAYYAALPRSTGASDRGTGSIPALARVGDPMRGIAPCASCHGGIDHKLGASWLEGMPKAYLAAQLSDFASGVRRNDAHAQMRSVARSISAKEIDSVSAFYAGEGASGAAR